MYYKNEVITCKTINMYKISKKKLQNQLDSFSIEDFRGSKAFLMSEENANIIPMLAFLSPIKLTYKEGLISKNWNKIGRRK